MHIGYEVTTRMMNTKFLRHQSKEAVMHNSLWKNSIIKLKQKNYEENF